MSPSKRLALQCGFSLALAATAANLKILAVAAIGFLFLIAAIIGAISHMGQGGGIVKENRHHLTVLHIQGPIMESEAWLESIRRIWTPRAGPWAPRRKSSRP